MTHSDSEQNSTGHKPTVTNKAVAHLEQAIRDGRHWYPALLEAISLWELSSENYNGRDYQYLIGGDALDWLILAERLCQPVNGLLPPEEKTALLLEGQPPLEMTTVEFGQLIGKENYKRYLNFFYGVTVEEVLPLAVQDEVRKEWHGLKSSRDTDIANEAYHRIYGETREELLAKYYQQKGQRSKSTISLTELKEFTYWLFKYRLNNSDKAKAASDTKKGLAKLKDLTEGR